MQHTVEHLLEEIKRHHLMPSREWAAMRERWLRPGRKEAAESLKFCRWLVVNDYLSELQVRYLVTGRAELLLFGDFRIRDRITKGPMAGALRADDRLGRQVAIELLAPPVAESPAKLAAIRQVVHKLMRLSHPNVGRMLGLGSAHGHSYLVKEAYEGETLAAVLQRRGRLRPEQALRLFGFALAALQALHEQGIPGGELSPECLLLTAARGQRREVKLLHAGLRRRLFDSSSLARKPGPQADEDALPSTSFFLEPMEQVRPEEDLFRMGEVFYLALTGQPPFPAQQLPQPGQKAEPVRRLVPEVPDMLADLVERMIDPAPTSRPTTAGLAARTVRIILATEEESQATAPEENLPLPSATPSKNATEPKPPRRKKRKKQRPPSRAEVGTTRAPAATVAAPTSRFGLPREAWQGAPLFAAAGACLFLTAVVLLQLLTGWEFVNLVCLLAGASLSFLAEQLLRQQARA